MAAIHCPTCQRLYEPGDFRFGPFCSERCQQIDLGRWLRESYSFPATRDCEEVEGDPAGEAEDRLPGQTPRRPLCEPSRESPRESSRKAPPRSTVSSKFRGAGNRLKDRERTDLWNGEH